MENKHRIQRVEILKCIPGYFRSAPCSSIWRNVAPCVVPRRFINGLLMVLEVWDKMGHDDKGEKAPSVIVHLFEVRLPGNSRLLMVPPLLKHTGRSHFFHYSVVTFQWMAESHHQSRWLSQQMDGASQTKDTKNQTLAQSSSTASGNMAFVCVRLSLCPFLTSIWSKANRWKQQWQEQLIWLVAVDILLIVCLSTQNHVDWLSGSHHWRALAMWMLFNCLCFSN